MDDLAKRISEHVTRARTEGRNALLEPEGLDILDAVGIRTPPRAVVSGPAEVDAIDDAVLAGDRVVVKVVSPDILHKSDVGGIAIVDADRAAIARAIEDIADRLGERPRVGYLVTAFVPHDPGFGGELLLGLRSTPDFGPVVTFGPGGVYTEHLAANLKPGAGAVILSPRDRDRALARIEASAVTPPVLGRLRGQKARIAEDRLVGAVTAFLDLAAIAPGLGITDFEINPLVASGGEPVALDALIKLGGPEASIPPPRPLDKIGSMLRPESIAVVGVSRRMNPGHVILNNTLRAGFDPGRITVVKPGVETFEGCRAVPDIASLPDRVDLLIVAVEAAQVPELVESVVALRRAETMIVIPGGLGETAGSEDRAGRMMQAVRDARDTDWRGPVINGGNCLGIRSEPGEYDTLFIPEYKLGAPVGDVDPVALLSQSGAFAIAQASKMTGIRPQYVATLGNQADLTVGDYLEYLKNDDTLQVFACYVEGFRPGDGARWLDAAADIVASGRHVVLYRAGRTAAGAKASASHTASIAGDYEVTRQLAEAAGVVVADSLADFHDLVRLFSFLEGRVVAGYGLGAVSNAGFECVAIADRLGPFRLARFATRTESALHDTLRAARLDGIVDVHNPIDLTPIMTDEPYARAVEAVLDDPGVDAAVIGCVPLTPALATLAPGDGHDEDVRGEGSIATRLIACHRRSTKPWIAVIDSGRRYDAMAGYLVENRVPTFRTADRALRLFGQFCRARRGD